MSDVKLIEIKKLTLLDNNPRKITDTQFKKLCKSLDEDPDFFYKRPCLVNESDGGLYVYAGNQRVLAAKKLGWQSVPCSVDYNLPDAVMRERIIKDNKHYGEFDFDILGNEWEIDLLLESGFTEDELQFRNIDTIEDKSEKPKQKKCILCPACGYEIDKKG